MIKILVTGDRNWKNKDLIKKILTQFDPKEAILIHGAAKGADSLSQEAALELGWSKRNIYAYPAEWHKFGRAAGPLRNRQMLTEHPDIAVVLAFHDNIDSSKGTKDMINVATKAKKKVILYSSNAFPEN